MDKSVNHGGANMKRRATSIVGPAKPAVPLPRKVQALIKMRESRGNRVINAGGGGCNMASSAAVSTVRNLPKVYSPLYEFSNLMLPRDLKTMNAWNRHFFATNPIVRNAVTLHATYPISKFTITCEDPKIKEFFEEMFDRMGFRGLLMGIALEFWKLGECFPYLELDEDNGVWDYAFLHNPDFIRVKTTQFARYPVIYLVPDDTLRRLVQGKTSADSMLRQQLPSETVHHIMKGEDIPLPNFNVSHMKMMNSEYDIRGTSLITSCYKDLMLYDKLREMQFAQADGMINPITLVKLGDPNGQWRPNDEDIRSFQQIMEESQYDPDFKIVTHGAVSIERIGYSGATLEVSQMWDAINKNLYTGLLAPEAILNGEGPNYSTASIGLEVLRTRYDRFREQLSDWIEKKVMEPICKLQDFYTTKGGARKLVVPKVQWNRLNLRDTDSYITAITGLLATSEAPGKACRRCEILHRPRSPSPTVPHPGARQEMPGVPAVDDVCSMTRRFRGSGRWVEGQLRGRSGIRWQALDRPAGCLPV